MKACIMGSCCEHSVLWALSLTVLGWISDVASLKDVALIAPSAVRLGDIVQLGCKWTLEPNETLYSVKWYRGRQEFFSYLPKEYPFTRIFAQPGIDVDVARSTSQQVVLREAPRSLAGRYRCEVSADAPSFHTQVRSAYIHVVELPPDKPTIKAEKGWYASGDSLRAQCSSPPADPPANLTWLLNGRGIQGQPVIQQRILPSPAVSIDAPQRAPAQTGDENNHIIFSPWKAFGPFVDTIQDGETLQGQDTVVLPTPHHHDSALEEELSDPSPTADTSNKVASVSQLSFIVRPDSFERGQLRLSCVSTVHSVYKESAELVINEERPQIASVLGTRDAASGIAPASLLVTLCCSTVTFTNFILRCQTKISKSERSTRYDTKIELQKAGAYFGQRVSLAIERGNVAILGSVPRDTDLEQENATMMSSHGRLKTH